jgi:hypothetical protein
VHEIRTQFKTIIEEISIENWRTDGGGEYDNKEVEEFFLSEGMKHPFTPPYSHECNRVAERYNQIIVTMARGMLMGLTLAL